MFDIITQGNEIFKKSITAVDHRDLYLAQSSLHSPVKHSLGPLYSHPIHFPPSYL